MTPNFSPSYDNKIARKYSAKTLEEKVQNKLALQEELGWPEEKKVPVVCVPVALTDANGARLFLEILPGLMELNVQLLVIGKGNKEIGEAISHLAKEKKHRVAIVKDTEDDRRKMYAAADMALFLADTNDVEELQHCLNYAAVPLAPATKALDNYNAVQESGNAFLYEKPNLWQCFASVARAAETFQFPYDWRTIQRHCMESVK